MAGRLEQARVAIKVYSVVDSATPKFFIGGCFRLSVRFCASIG